MQPLLCYCGMNSKHEDLRRIGFPCCWTVLLHLENRSRKHLQVVGQGITAVSEFAQHTAKPLVGNVKRAPRVQLHAQIQ